MPFLGYFLFEIPSNLILERVGARVWIARIMIVWGLVSMAMMLVTGAAKISQDYTTGLLFLAGGLVLEALLVLSLRLPERDRAVKAAAA